MTDSHTGSRTRGPVTRVILRICGWTFGGIAAFAAVFWAVTATADLALSAGVYGTPGTYKVVSCYDTNDRRNRSDYDCYGDFTPDGRNADDAVSVDLEDTGHDYPDGTEFDARQGLEPQTIQRAGIRGIVGELWQIGFAVTALAWLAYLVIRPPKSGNPNRSREPSRREKAAENMGGAVVVCVAVGILGWIANLAVSIAS
ncbi:hypothetical protein AB0I98_40210 [Streptomyces sp. NPDC050211]|uniref:hypothetical protein n=1 Tax=Streptomyces sp. NPDC050211 TaxID=3154932 RepID=UPI0034182619